MFPKHFTIPEICEILSISDDLARKLFRDEPGVIIIFHQKPGRRAYRTLRIPEPVFERVLRRMTS